MKTIIMAVVKSDAESWPLMLLREIGNPNISDINRWSVELAGDWIAVSKSMSIEEDYEPDELNKINELITDPNFYLIESRSENMMKDYILKIPRNVKAIIDNDHGWIASAMEYKHAITNKENWLYKKS